MPATEPNRYRFALSTGVFVVLALAGCERTPPATEVVTERPPPRAAVEAPVPTAPAPDPDDAMAGASYEVSIASAAANRKRALEQCESAPASERADCVAEVEADWEVAKSTVDDLRGEQQ